MKRTGLISFAAAGLLMMASCDSLDLPGMFWSRSDTVEERFAQSMAYNDANGYESVSVDSDDYQVYAFTDFHTFGDTRNLDAFIAAYEAAPAPLSLYLGDMVDDREADWDIFINAARPLSEKGMLFVTPGNHDLYFGLWQEYVSRFHTASYWFEMVGPNAKDLYLCLDSGSGTLGRSQRAWLEDILKTKASSYRHVIVFTHTHLFKIDASQGHTGNYDINETYDLLQLFSEYGVDIVLTGHDHTVEHTAFGGVDYYVVPSLENTNDHPGYAIFSVGEGIDLKIKYLN